MGYLKSISPKHNSGDYHYTKLRVVRSSVCPCVRPESLTGSHLTPVKKPAFFASLSFDVTEAVDRKSYIIATALG